MASSCGTVTRVGTVILQTDDGAEVALAAGETVSGLMLPNASLPTTVSVLAAQERAALDPECALGPDVLGPEVAIVMTQNEVEGK